MQIYIIIISWYAYVCSLKTKILLDLDNNKSKPGGDADDRDIIIVGMGTSDNFLFPETSNADRR